MTGTDRWVLVLNCGSSSVKLALVDPETGRRGLTGLAERLYFDDAVATWSRGADEVALELEDAGHRGAIAALLGALTPQELAGVVGVGHRVVHGGKAFGSAVVVDDEVLEALRRLVPLAPLHNPANIAGIEAARDELPEVPQVAVFDTAFHQTMPPVAYRYAVPASWYDDLDVRRYGFHGTSHRFVSARAAEMLGRSGDPQLRLVTLHLGNGASAAAVRGGRSIDTTMGLTPLEGLVMGTRSGDIDPGVLGYVGGRLGLDLPGVLTELNGRSGLLGLSGMSNDMRTLADAAESGSASAALAIDVFCYRAAKTVGALAVALDGLDGVVLTGGIGEHAPGVRAGIVARLGVLGVHLDPAANADHGRATGGRISLPGGPAALVVPTDEERVIALDTLEAIA